MKKWMWCLGLWAVVCFPAADLSAQIDQLSNLSAEWIRLPTRNAATDSTDIVYYNPAGLTQMTDGLHLNLSNQSLFRRPNHSYNLGLPGADTYQESVQDGVDWLLPNFYAAYKKDNWAIFGGIYIPGGGAVADYPNGSVNTKFIGSMTLLNSGGRLTGFSNDSLEASSLYLTSTIGGAYAVSDKISVAVGIRYISARNETEAGAVFTDALGGSHEYRLDTEDTASGFGGIFGLNIQPVEKLNIGMRYESSVPLTFETEVNCNDFPQELGLAEYKDRNRRDFPGAFGVGAAYQMTPKLTGEVDFTYYLQQQANWGYTDDGESVADMAGDCWGLGAGLAYQLTEKLQLSTGALFTKFEWDDIHGYYQTPGAFETLYSDNWNLGIGCAYEIRKGLKLNLGAAYTLWEDETIAYSLAAENGLGDVQVDTHNSTLTLAIGIDAAF
ncbi:MAG: OmpP1/FadL family transporter [Thermodesulfobacteriota bacterium]